MSDPTLPPVADLAPPAVTASEASVPAAGETVAMSAAAGGPPAAAPLSPPKKKKKDKKKKDETAMVAAAPTDDLDATIRELGTKRGIETMFRTSYRVNMDLTSLADAKANIMISINGLIISILIAQIASKVDANPWLYAPTSIFVVGCLVSLILAVIAARPRIQTRVITMEEVRRTKPNILFFGNFAHLSQKEFVLAMKERMQDPTDLYTMMIDDIYGVGSVLQKKYMLLRASYGAFMVALVLGVLSFVFVFGYAAFSEAGPAIYAPAPGTTAPAPVPTPSGTLLTP